MAFPVILYWFTSTVALPSAATALETLEFALVSILSDYM